MNYSFACFGLTFVVAGSLFADGPADNLPDKVRPVPPIGVELSPSDEAELTNGLKQLQSTIEFIKKKKDDQSMRLLPDVKIFARAIKQGLDHREFFSQRDVANAKKVLAEGKNRAIQLAQGKAPWTTQKGLVVRGFRSRIDQTVQPYGLVIPDSYTSQTSGKYRADIWLHGRGERSSEPVFINERMTRVGRYAPADTIVIHPYGRYSNAFKFAGEIDVLEALVHAQANYRIDDDRVSIRGFSMGGAGCWQMAAHYPSLFFAANPGAGFSETREFLRFFQKEEVNPTPWQEKLYQWYDCPVYSNNFANLPTIAYSGEDDIQKQAADIMEKALQARRLKLTHIIGPKTKHTIHPDSMEIIESKMASLAKIGRQSFPNTVVFTTPTLRYNRSQWVEVHRLEHHWKPATILAHYDETRSVMDVRVDNVSALKISFPAGFSPFRKKRSVSVLVWPLVAETDKLQPDRVVTDATLTDGSWEVELHKADDKWKLGPPPADRLVKKHGLQGPIDDAFMDSFIVVKPTGKAFNESVGKWTTDEMNHFVQEWRRQFRGDAVVKNDTDITADDIAKSNLILFGDMANNVYLKSIAADLPIAWDSDELKIAGREYDSANHAPIMIYPNPKNPEKYVVLNSGFTYREYAYLNNARQVPMLPDWAIVDLRTPPDFINPGKVVAADFFNEQWEVK